MKLLVCGGAGFIGSNFVRFTLDRYTDDVVVLDKLTYAGNLENLAEFAGNGNTASSSTDNSVTFDNVAPAAPTGVNDGTGADAAYTTSTTTLSANWTASVSVDVIGYEYAIGTSAGGTQILGFTDAGNVTSVTRTGLTLTSGTTYFVSVRAYDGAGNRSSATSSNGIMVDNVAPTSTVTSPGSGTFISSLATISGTASDAASSVQKVEVSVKRNSDNLYWNGSTFASASEVFNLAAGTTSWSFAFGTPAEAVNFRKQQQLRRLAGRWLAGHAAGGATLRFDVASVRPDGRGGWVVDVLTNAIQCRARHTVGTGNEQGEIAVL